MSLVEIDETGTFTIPEKMGIKNKKAFVIPAVSYFITIPLPEKSHGNVDGWLSAN